MTFLNNKKEPLLAALFYFIFYPCHKQVDYLFLLNIGQGYALGNIVPLIQASSAAAGAGVLCFKNGMPAHRCLLAVIWNTCGCKSFGNKGFAMGANGVNSLLLYIFPIRL